MLRIRIPKTTHVALSRAASTRARPPFYDVFPKKNIMNRVFFDLDSRYNYRKLYSVFESIYQKLGTDEEPVIPKFVNASDLMIMKRSLETIRVRSHTTNKHLLDLENELVEKAAEHGNNDAVALLAFEAIMNESAPEDDRVHGKKLVAKLLEMKHPLTIKMSGDLCVKNEMNSQAESFYLDFLKIENDTFLASEVYKSLGKIYFKRVDLVKSKQYFERSVKTGPIDKLAESHFYLGQLNTHDPNRSRFHLEMSASQGFRESFQLLGFLELNYYNNVAKAKEWFKIGAELSDLQSIVGLFDCYIRDSELAAAKKTYITLESMLKESEDPDRRKVWAHFIEDRKTGIDKLESVDISPKPEIFNVEVNKDTATKQDRWSI